MESNSNNRRRLRAGAALLLTALCWSCAPGLWATCPSPATWSNDIAGLLTGGSEVMRSPSGDQWAVMSVGEGCRPGALILSDLAGNDRFLARRPDGPSQLAWSGDGASIVYDELVQREIPGQYNDWNLPARETLGGRLWAVAPEGGEPRLLAEGQQQFFCVPAPAGPYVAYFTKPLSDVSSATPAPQTGVTSPSSAFHLLNLETSREELLIPTASAHGFQWSPDGAKVAYVEYPSGGSSRTLVVFDRATQTSKRITPYVPEQFFWQGGKICIVAAGDVQNLVVYDLADDTATTVPITLPSRPIGSYFGMYRPSPDGTMLLAHTFGSGDPLTLRYVVFSIPERKTLEITDLVPPRHGVFWRGNLHLVAVPAPVPLKAETIEVRFSTSGARELVTFRTR
jgi:hypothetical protein